MIRLLLRTVLLFFVLIATFTSVALAQGSQGTVYDEAGVLSDSDKQEVQAAFERVREQTGHPLYAFLVTDTNVTQESARRELLAKKARQANVPADAGVIVVAPNDRWSEVKVGKLSADSQAVYQAMLPDFQKGDYSSGLIAGAQEIENESGQARGNTGSSAASGLGTVGLVLGGVLLALAVLVGGAFFLRGRHRRLRELAESRRTAEDEFAGLTSRIEEFDEKERLVSGYLEAQRPLLDRATEEEVEATIREAKASGFGQELNEAAAYLQSAPEEARTRIARGRELMEKAMENLREAEKTIDDCRGADEALEGKLREAQEEIGRAEAAEKPALEAGAYMQPMDLRPEQQRLTSEVTSRAAHRKEFDPRQALAEVEALIDRAQERRRALEDEVASKARLKDTRRSAQSALNRASEVLEEYRKSYASAEERWGPAALEPASAPEALSSQLEEAAEHAEKAGRLEGDGRYAESRSRLEQAESIAKSVIGAPAALREAVVAADRKKREGEEKLKELEARLEQAKANEHLMSPLQRERLREYEYQLQNARSGFFGSDWLTALLLFEALDHNYVFMDGAPFVGGDWGGDAGGDWGGDDGGDWGGGDWGGGGDFGGGGW
jgi:uncharacterized membrane protein YgcG